MELVCKTLLWFFLLVSEKVESKVDIVYEVLTIQSAKWNAQQIHETVLLPSLIWTPDINVVKRRNFKTKKGWGGGWGGQGEEQKRLEERTEEIWSKENAKRKEKSTQNEREWGKIGRKTQTICAGGKCCTSLMESLHHSEDSKSSQKSTLVLERSRNWKQGFQLGCKQGKKITKSNKDCKSNR